ncbi:MAG TPA: hypothetical protein VFW49_13435 [Fluviicoccus sp.]|nr:hypothetical protein [Fluviicoccus sp.]
MTRLTLAVICSGLLATPALADSSFNEVRNVIFTPPPPGQTAAEQQEMAVYAGNRLPHYEVSSRQFIRDGVNLLKADAQRTLNETADYYPRLEKHLHSNGICFTGRWKITAETPYSGGFRQGSEALLIARASTALTETERGDPRAFGFAGKLFPTLDPDQKTATANFFLVDVLAGAQRDHYLDTGMTNKPSTGFRFGVIPLALRVGRVFSQADSDPGYRPVTGIAAFGLKPGEAAKAPRFLRLKGADRNRRNEAADFREELDLRRQPSGTLAFTIQISDQSADQDSPSWLNIGEVVLTESRVTYGCDRRLHFAHPKLK